MGADRALAVSCYDGAGPRTLPVLFFIVVGVFFWWRGRRTRERAARLAADVEPPAS